MRNTQPTRRVPAVLVLLLLPVTACSVDTTRTETGATSSVDIRTPVGNLSVNGDSDPGETGLPVYPGARISRRGDRDENATVDVGGPGFGVKVVAAKFETDASSDTVIGFYRNAMSAYGAVTVCRGDVDFNERDPEPVCEEDPDGSEVQLMTGTKRRRRLVAVKPHGGGAEFSLVYVQTGSDF